MRTRVATTTMTLFGNNNYNQQIPTTLNSFELLAKTIRLIRKVNPTQGTQGAGIISLHQ
jgi:hypothetical protein